MLGLRDVILFAIFVAIVAGAAAYAVVAEVKAARAEAARGRAIALLTLFAPALDAVQRDPRALLVWEPLARRVRAMAPDEVAALEKISGGPFPFPPDAVQAAHAQWTADWLAWEQTHDAEYKAKAREAEHDRAKLDLVEREKLDRYQRRYQEYVRVSKALQALMSTSRG